MRFWTDVSLSGSKILYRGYENGRKVQRQVKYQPYLFIQDHAGDYRSLDGKKVKKKPFNSIWDAKQYIERNRGISNNPIYGYDRFEYLFLADRFPEDVVFDTSLVTVANIDIEVAGDEGFPVPDVAAYPITAITVMFGGSLVAFGCGDFDPPSHVTYFKCKDEQDLIHKFLDIWNNKFPDIVTGWNCMPVNTPVWKNQEIVALKDIKKADHLFDSNVTTIFPFSYKKKWKIKLANGSVVESSGDHIFPVRHIGHDTYSKLSHNHKSKDLFDEDFKVSDIPWQNRSCFVQIPMRNNTNSDQNYTDEQLYLAGLIYTDGSLKDRGRPLYGYNIYQNNIEFLQKVSDRLKTSLSISGNSLKGYAAYVNRKHIGNAHKLIYDKSDKSLNLTLLSRLSSRQFYSFISGLLDGDGCKRNGTFGFCNYQNDDIFKIEQLCWWNGIFTTIFAENHGLKFYDLDTKKLTTLHDRWINCEDCKLDRNSSQKGSQTRFKKIDNVYYVKISSIQETDDEVKMLDIETDTHYFVASGMKVHNCSGFDIPYLINRITKLLGAEMAQQLSPWRQLKEKRFFFQGKEKVQYQIIGLQILDYMDIFKKLAVATNAVSAPDNYKLDTVAFDLLGERKIQHDYGSLLELYRKDFQTFMTYNIRDVELVDRINQKLKIIEQVITMAYLARVNYEDMLGSVNPWTSLAHYELLQEKIVFPPRQTHEAKELIGGFVKEPTIGGYEWVVTLDLTSLYPKLISQYNISPETMRGKLIDSDIGEDQILNGALNDYKQILLQRNVTVAGNLMTYDREKKGFLPRILEKIFDKRADNKKTMLNTDQQYQNTKKSGGDVTALEKTVAMLKNLDKGYKVFLNSAYGVLNNAYFILYNFENAEAVTKSGRLSIRWISKEMNQYLNRVLKTDDVEYVIGADTDSMFLNLKEIADRLKRANPTVTDDEIRKQIKKICVEKFQPFINKAFERLAEYVNAREQAMDMKLEAICSRAIFLGKKHYILNILEKENVVFAEPKIDLKGIAAVKSTTPSVCRSKLKDAIKLIMLGDETGVIKLISDFRKEFRTLSFDDIGFSKTLNGMAKYYDPVLLFKKRCPIHVRAALLWNRAIEERKLKTLPKLYEGDKPKFVYLKEPNVIRDNVISTPGPLPPELKIEQCIDYNLNFEKGFIEPLSRITNAIGWKMKKTSTLEDRLFG